jgi:hypothetical protein
MDPMTHLGQLPIFGRGSTDRIIDRPTDEPANLSRSRDGPTGFGNTVGTRVPSRHTTAAYSLRQRIPLLSWLTTTFKIFTTTRSRASTGTRLVSLGEDSGY